MNFLERRQSLRENKIFFLVMEMGEPDKSETLMKEKLV